MYDLRRRGELGPGMELNPVFKKISRLKKSLLLNRIKEVETAGQDPTQLRSHKLPTCEKELKESLEPGVVLCIFNTTPGDRWISKSEANIVYKWSLKTANLKSVKETIKNIKLMKM